MSIGRKFIWRASGFFILAVAWQFYGNIRASPAVPSLDGVLRTFFVLLGDDAFRRHIAASLSIVLSGLGVAVCIGFSVGVLLFQYERFRAGALPVIECVRGVASLTLFPLLIVLFGLGTFARVFIIVWTAWPSVVLSTLNSLHIDEDVVDAACGCGAGDWWIVFRIRVPIAAQGIVTGIRIAAGGGWIALIPAEMLGATRGLGYYLLWSSQSFAFEKVFATIITISAIGGMMNFILLFIQKKLTY